MKSLMPVHRQGSTTSKCSVQKLFHQRCSGFFHLLWPKSLCSYHCFYRWDAGEWGECSRTCGQGRQLRSVVCKQTYTQTLTTTVASDRCDQSTRPNNVQDCKVQSCAAWKAGEWGEVSIGKQLVGIGLLQMWSLQSFYFEDTTFIHENACIVLIITRGQIFANSGASL